jgi:hypothetical protein
MRTYPRRRKARRPGRISCGHAVQIGEQILSYDGTRWHCLPCALARVRAQHPPPTRPRAPA